MATRRLERIARARIVGLGSTSVACPATQKWTLREVHLVDIAGVNGGIACQLTSTDGSRYVFIESGLSTNEWRRLVLNTVVYPGEALSFQGQGAASQVDLHVSAIVLTF